MIHIDYIYILFIYLLYIIYYILSLAHYNNNNIRYKELRSYIIQRIDVTLIYHRPNMYGK
jgi:hypothetical protein